MLTRQQELARAEILACIVNARAALDGLEFQAKSGESIIGAHVRDYANDVRAWMYHAIEHATRQCVVCGSTVPTGYACTHPGGTSEARTLVRL